MRSPLMEAWSQAGLSEPLAGLSDEDAAAYAYGHGPELFAQLVARYNALVDEAAGLRPSLAGVRGEREAQARGAAAEFARVRELEVQRTQLVAALAALVRLHALVDRSDNGRPFARSMWRWAGVA
jgi:hypothetical protein